MHILHGNGATRREFLKAFEEPEALTTLFRRTLEAGQDNRSEEEVAKYTEWLEAAFDIYNKTRTFDIILHQAWGGSTSSWRKTGVRWQMQCHWELQMLQAASQDH